MKLFILLILFLNTALASICFETKHSMSCEHKKIKLKGLYANRDILIATPEKPAPKNGYPVILFFQGSFFPHSFKRNKQDPFGGYNEILTVKNLLDHGYMIIAPKAGAGLFWQTNLIGLDYDTSSDRYLIDKILIEIKNQTFGPADIDNLFAFGISSGGYMTDRMAWSHRQVSFNALAISSASYAVCGGPYCPLPDDVYADHPPTLFLHGKIDPVVPIATMKKYQKLLQSHDIKTKVVINKWGRHQWIEESPREILNWFNLHLKH